MSRPNAGRNYPEGDESLSTENALRPMNLPPPPRNPRVSVIVSNYNYAQFVGHAIESILGQTYSNFELIVCDDGSTDDSLDVIHSYAAFDSRVTLLSKENGGQASAFNAAYEFVSGEIICFLDSDDIFYPTKLEKVAHAFSENSASGLCVHRVLPISQMGNPIGPPIPRTLDSGWIAYEALGRGSRSQLSPTSGLCFRKEVTDKIFPIPSKFQRSADGYLLGVSQFLTSITAISEALAGYRLHDSNSFGASKPTSSSIKKSLRDSAYIVTKVKQFLQENYGEQVAQRLRLEDIPSYWEHFLAIYLLEARPQGGVCGYAVGDLIGRLPNSPRKRLWQLLLALPPTIAKRTFELWWGTSQVKRLLRPLGHLLRL